MTNFCFLKFSVSVSVSVIVSGNSGILLFLNLFTSDEVYAKRSIARDIEKLERRLFELIQMGKEEFEKP